MASFARLSRKPLASFDNADSSAVSHKNPTFPQETRSARESGWSFTTSAQDPLHSISLQDPLGFPLESFDVALHSAPTTQDPSSFLYDIGKTSKSDYTRENVQSEVSQSKYSITSISSKKPMNNCGNHQIICLSLKWSMERHKSFKIQCTGKNARRNETTSRIESKIGAKFE